MTHRAAFLLLGLLACSTADKNPPRPSDTWSAAHPVTTTSAEKGMVVAAAPIAAQVGADVLKSGGNAADAAVAVAFALSVVYPTAGNIGGGGFIVSRMGKESVALDFRETGPAAATRDMFLDDSGRVTEASVTGPRASGVPGSVAGLWAFHQKHGRRPWKDLVAPAIRLATEGFVTDSAFVDGIADEQSRLSRYPASAALFLPGGKPVAIGTTWKNPELAATLQRIADHGRDGFYTGETATRIASAMRRDGGLITTADLAAYQPQWRVPVEFMYRGHRVLSMPPVSSGGVTLAMIAGILEHFDLASLGWHSPEAIRIVAAAEREAFLRRNTLLGDPAFVKLPVEPFFSPDTAAAIAAAIRAGSNGPADGPPTREKHTTHFSVVDGEGNAVAMTTTINNGFGSAYAIAGGGFLMNDEMDDFTTKPGVVNAMGLRQWASNEIAPGKRMLSSMTPTIVLDSTGAPLLVVGAAGGARIITGVLQAIINVIDYRMTLGAALGAPRFHAQDFPDTVELERGGFDSATARALADKGMHTKPGPSMWRTWDYSMTQAILRADGRWHGVSDPRNFGKAVGY